MRLLRGSHTDEVGRDLYACLSDLLSVAGWASHDVGLPGPALRYIGQALAAAQEANDPMREALALEQIGRVYLRLDDPTEALKVFQLAGIAADRAHSNEVTAQVLASQARTHATMGDENKAIEALTRSGDSFTVWENSVTLPTPRTFDHATWTSETGKIHTILAAHNPRHATTAIDILAAYTADSGNARVKRRAFGMAELSLGHFRAGNAATAVSVGHRALDVAAGIRSHRLVEHLDSLRAEALRHPRNGDAVDLAHRIRPVNTA